jgi:hypothetical protein
MKNKNYKKGQIVLVVLLVTSAVMVMGLSLSRGSVKELKIDTNEETLKQTFNAAESGIDYFLTRGNDVEGVTYESPNKDFGASVTKKVLKVEDMANSRAVFFKPQFLQLDGYDGDLTITLDDKFKGVAKVDVFYNNGRVERYGYNFSEDEDMNITGFDQHTGEINIRIGSDSDFLVVTPLFAPTAVKFSGGNFVVQGERIVSTGKSNDGIESRVSVDEVWELPYFMLEGLVVEGEIGSGKNYEK